MRIAMNTNRCVSVVFVLLVVGLCGMGGCSSPVAVDLRLGALYTQGRYQKVTAEIQPRLDRGEDVSKSELGLLCDSYFKLRRYDKLIETANLLANRPDVGDTDAYGIGDYTVDPYIWRSHAYLDMGNCTKAISEASSGYQLLYEDGRDKKISSRGKLILILGCLGTAHALAGNRSEAARCVTSLEGISLSYPYILLGPEKHKALARIHMANGDFDRALAAITHPDARDRTKGDPRYENTFAMFSLGRAYEELPRRTILNKALYETGRVEEAKHGYDKLLAHPQIDQLGGMHWIILFDRARIAREEGQPDRAVAFLKQAVDVIEWQRASIHTETAKIGFVGDKQALYRELVSLLIEQSKTAEAFEYVERAKARALVDLLAGQKQLAVNRDEGKRLNEKVTQLAKAETKSLVLPDPKDKGAAGRTRGVVIALKKELVGEAPELASLVTVMGTSTKEIQSLLRPDEALVEYFQCTDNWCVFVVTSQDITASKFNAPNLASQVSRFHRAMSDRTSTDYHRHGGELYDRLIRPVADRLERKKLIIVPHGPLHYVPFGALYDGSEYLVDHHSLRILPSASVLKFLKERKSGSGALVLGNPDLGNPQFDLKHAQDEAMAIAKVLTTTTTTKLLLRREATETFVKAHGWQFRTIHFATHGTFYPHKPLNSALLLAPDATNDGQLRVAELYTLRLNADLVTLSGCETALGKVANGDDVVGFTRGLLYAGTSSIISTLWKVPDKATRDLMVDFYSHLAKTDKQEALRQAQLRIRQTRPHPYYWAAFVLTGRAH